MSGSGKCWEVADPVNCYTHLFADGLVVFNAATKSTSSLAFPAHLVFASLLAAPAGLTEVQLRDALAQHIASAAESVTDLAEQLNAALAVLERQHLILARP